MPQLLSTRHFTFLKVIYRKVKAKLVFCLKTWLFLRKRPTAAFIESPCHRGGDIRKYRKRPNTLPFFNVKLTYHKGKEQLNKFNLNMAHCKLLIILQNIKIKIKINRSLSANSNIKI